MAEAISIEELEKRLEAGIGMPLESAEETGAFSVADSSMVVSVPMATLRLNYAIELRYAILRDIVQDLRVQADRIGTIPSSYPWPVDLIMRVISALIPWYTRPLHQFAKRTTEAAEVFLQSIADLADAQAHLAAQLESSERQANRPPGKSSSRTRVIKRQR